MKNKKIYSRLSIRQTNIRLHFLAILTSSKYITLFSKIRYNREVKRLELTSYLNSIIDFRKWQIRIFILLNTRWSTHRQTNSQVKRLISIISFSFKSASVYNWMFLRMKQEELCRLQAVKESKNKIYKQSLMAIMHERGMNFEMRTAPIVLKTYLSKIVSRVAACEPEWKVCKIRGGFWPPFCTVCAVLANIKSSFRFLFIMNEEAEWECIFIE